MQELPPPPPPPAACVKAQDAAGAHFKLYIVASGEPVKMEDWLKDVRGHPGWRLDADTLSDGIRFVRLSADGPLSYRDIGGLIYLGQTRKLSIAFKSEPAICEADEQ